MKRRSFFLAPLALVAPLAPARGVPTATLEFPEPLGSLAAGLGQGIRIPARDALSVATLAWAAHERAYIAYMIEKRVFSPHEIVEFIAAEMRRSTP